jgi:hypothetical protein
MRVSVSCPLRRQVDAAPHDRPSREQGDNSASGLAIHSRLPEAGGSTSHRSTRPPVLAVADPLSQLARPTQVTDRVAGLRVARVGLIAGPTRATRLWAPSIEFVSSR